MIQGSFLMNWKKSAVKCKEGGTDEGPNPLIYVTKTWEYKSSLRKLICKLRISFTNKNIRKKLKVLVAFLTNQKIGGQLGFLPRFFLKIIPSKLWESHLAKKIHMQISF